MKNYGRTITSHHLSQTASLEMYLCICTSLPGAFTHKNATLFMCVCVCVCVLGLIRHGAKHCSTLQHGSAAENTRQMGISVLWAPSREICRMGVPTKEAVLRTHTIRKETVLRQGSPTFLRPRACFWTEKWSRDSCHVTQYKLDLIRLANNVYSTTFMYLHTMVLCCAKPL